MKNFIEKLKEDLIRDEGKKLDVYHCLLYTSDAADE